MNASESLQEYARRAKLTPSSAYSGWHAQNSALARAWSVPFSAKDESGRMGPRVIIESGRCRGLTERDIKALDAAFTR